MHRPEMKSTLFILMVFIFTLSFKGFSDYAPPSVNGWPSGVITNASVSYSSLSMSDFNFKGLHDREVRSVFTYAVGGGGDTYQLKKIADPFKTRQLIQQAMQLEIYYGQKIRVMPVVVVYTAGGSTGPETINIDLGQNAKYPDNLWLRLYNLIRIAQTVESALDLMHPVPATLLLNPDFLGEVHKSCQKYYCPVDYKNMKIPLGHSLIHAMHELINDGFLDKIPGQMPNNILSDSASFSDYLEAVNWVVHHFAPHAVLGWQDNIWAGDSMGHRWIHKAVNSDHPDAEINQHTRDESEFLKTLRIFDQSNPLCADFIAFDKWERDNFTQLLAGAGVNAGYLYNAPAYETYVKFIRGVSNQLDNLPVMLFQLPGGHLQIDGDIDKRNDHGSTGPDYVLGDPNIKSDLSNIAQYIGDYHFAHPMQDYFIDNSSVIDYLKRCPLSGNGCVNGVYDWRTSHVDDLFKANVFAILWGGGSTTSLVGLTQDLDDSGWLKERIKTFSPRMK